MSENHTRGSIRCTEELTRNVQPSASFPQENSNLAKGKTSSHSNKKGHFFDRRHPNKTFPASSIRPPNPAIDGRRRDRNSPSFSESFHLFPSFFPPPNGQGYIFEKETKTNLLLLSVFLRLPPKFRGFRDAALGYQERLRCLSASSRREENIGYG